MVFNKQIEIIDMRVDDLEKTIGTQKQMIDMLNNMIISQKLVIDMMISRITSLENTRHHIPPPEVEHAEKAEKTVVNNTQPLNDDIYPLNRRVIL